MMKWGYSQHWTKTLLQFTGDSTYNTTALLDYFKPLDDYLTEYLNNRSIIPGWNDSCPLAPDAWNTTTTAGPGTTTTSTPIPTSPTIMKTSTSISTTKPTPPTPPSTPTTAPTTNTPSTSKPTVNYGELITPFELRYCTFNSFYKIHFIVLKF